MGTRYRVVGPPPVIFVLGLLAGIALDGFVSDSDLPDLPALVAGGALVLVGVLLQARFLLLFKRARTPILPGEEASRLVVDGPYRFTRNPGYVGMSLLGTGIALIADAPWALLGVALAAIVVDRGVIRHEERYLAERFGEEYRAYCARVRRWL